MNLKSKCDNLLNTWINNNEPDGEYKLTGPYWEVLYPILKTHSPELLKKYEGIVGEFDYFNEEVKNKFSTGIDELDFKNAISYMNAREKNYSTPNETHQVDLGDDRVISYLPNQSMDEDIFD
jgi:hypothetical protein